MKFIEKKFFHTYEEKKSKFIAYIFDYKYFDETMQKLQNKYSKARHFVYAYRYLNDFGQIVENSSDDGEPKGTSGKPTLSVLRGNKIINSGIITVRYFGGIKLGTGGLVRAYSNVANELIKKSNLVLYEELISKIIYISYADLSKIKYLCATHNIHISNKEFLDKVTLHLEATAERFHIFKEALPAYIEVQ